MLWGVQIFFHAYDAVFKFLFTKEGRLYKALI
jgi:hypothetical protein